MEQILKIFKMDLGITSTARDDYFGNLINSCIKELEAKGIPSNENDAEYMMLVSDYAAWRYRKREENTGLPANIKMRIRDRQIKARSETNVI